VNARSVRQMWQRLIGLGLLAVVLCTSGCAGTVAPTAPSVARPPSLADAKHQVSEYVDSGRYDADIAAVAEQASVFLEARAQREDKLAIVVDIDETALSNLPSLRANDYGFIVGARAIFHAVRAGCSPGSGWPAPSRSSRSWPSSVSRESAGWPCSS